MALLSDVPAQRQSAERLALRGWRGSKGLATLAAMGAVSSG